MGLGEAQVWGEEQELSYGQVEFTLPMRLPSGCWVKGSGAQGRGG